LHFIQQKHYFLNFIQSSYFSFFIDNLQRSVFKQLNENKTLIQIKNFSFFYVIHYYLLKKYLIYLFYFQKMMYICSFLLKNILI